MRQRCAGGVIAALWVGLAVSAAGAAGDGGDLHSMPPDDKPTSPWLPIWMGGRRNAFSEKKPAEAPKAAKTDKADKPDKDKDKDKPAPRPQPADGATTQERELNAYWRRIEVCDQLREFAVQAGNEELERQADELSQRAFAIYQQRSRTAAAAGAPSADEAALDKQLGTDKAKAETALQKQRAADAAAAAKQRAARAWEGRP
jgi:hypothetical protein